MTVTIKTPFGETDFEMERDKANDLMCLAFRYAGEQREEAPAPKPSAGSLPDKSAKAVKSPCSRIERMFGDWKARIPKAAAPEAHSIKPETYKGFLLIRCEHCGKLKGFCTRHALSKYLCDCGMETELCALPLLHLHCKCGKYFRYRTNVTGDVLEYPCLECGSPVDLMRDKKGNYITIGTGDKGDS